MITFYGAKNPYGFLSNFYPADFELWGKTFHSVEQAMHYGKAMLFGDTETAEKILDCKTPLQCKRLGRQVTPFYPEVWAGTSQMIVFQACFEKFNQNPDIREQLLATGDEMLVELSTDKIWGIGRKSKEKAEKFEDWNGMNKLGFVLMAVRRIC